MPLTQEQMLSLKNQLKQQVANLPEDKKAMAITQIDSLSESALEELLKEQQEKKGSPENNKSVFRMIVDGDIPSTKIDENKVALAVLDIMPVSKAHAIIIPKKEIKDAKLMPTSAFSLAKKIGKSITSKFKASSIEIQTETKFGESIINVIPCYEEKLNLNSKRTKAENKDLEDIAKFLRPKPKIQKIKIKSKTSSQNQAIKISRRIP